MDPEHDETAEGRDLYDGIAAEQVSGDLYD